MFLFLLINLWVKVWLIKFVLLIISIVGLGLCWCLGFGVFLIFGISVKVLLIVCIIVIVDVLLNCVFIGVLFLRF